MERLAIAIACADRRRHKAQRIMNSKMPYAMRLAAVLAMGGERRVM